MRILLPLLFLARLAWGDAGVLADLAPALGVPSAWGMPAAMGLPALVVSGAVGSAWPLGAPAFAASPKPALWPPS